MATTFDVNRIGGGTFELVQDPTTGRYTIKEVGFTPVKKLTLPDYTTAGSTAGTTDTSKATTEATTQTLTQQTTEAFKPAGGGEAIDYTGSEMLSQAQLQKEAKKIDPQVDTTTTSLGVARPTMRDIAGDTTQQTTKSSFERPTMRDIAGDTTQPKAPGIVVDKTPISPFRSLSLGAQQVQAPQAYASTTADARAAMTSDAAQLGISKVAAQPLDTARFAGSTAGTLADPAEKEDVKPEAPTTGLSTVKTGLQSLATSVGKVLTSGPIATIARSIAANIQESPTDKFNKSYFNVMDNGRVGGNPATDVFAGMNAVSAFGDIARGARTRIATRKNTIATKNVSQKFIDDTKKMEKQLEEYNNKKNKEVADRAKAKAENKEVYGSRKESTGKDSFGEQTKEEAAYGSCFIAGTKITMADGTTKNIEDIIVGDKVKGYKGDNEVIKLDPTLLGERKLYSFNNTEHYFFTSEHPFMTDEGWKSIKPEKTKERDGIELYNQLKGELKVGDKLITENGLLEITDIKSKDIESPKTPLYNFNVSNDNSYIADKYVVHNKGGGGGSQRVICTELNKTGELSTADLVRDIRFTYRHLSKKHLKGYLAWAIPTVRHIQKFKTYRKVWKHIAQHRANDIAWRMNQGKFDLLGRIYAGIGEPLCWLIGNFVSDKNYNLLNTKRNRHL